MSTRGAYEWAYKNLNICYGCLNNCSYCYATRMALRFGRIETKEQWTEIKLNPKKIKKGYNKLKNPFPELYDYMFPTSHDIFPEILPECITVLKKVLRAGNSVLITTKPRIECIKELCAVLEKWKKQICFRFTITSAYNETLEKYEPGASLFQERMMSVRHAFQKGYKTSLSLEPLLDPTPLPILDHVEKYVDDEIWIGIMSGSIPDELKDNYSLDNIKLIYEECRNLHQGAVNKIRFKDSIVNKLKLERNRL